MTLRSRVQSAFTITELLVVVAVVALLIAVGTPAVISSLRSINRSLADTQLRVAIVGARDAAIRNAGRGDAMAVFTFEPGQRTQVYVCLYAGTLQDVDADNQAIQRDIFVPDVLSEPISLPNGWSVRGYVPPFRLADASAREWYNQTYDDSGDFTRGNWVFPETGFFDAAEGDEGDKRQSFAIRFRSGTGQIATERQDEALILLPAEPVAGADFRDAAPFSENNALEALDLRRFVVRVLSDPDLAIGAQPANRQLLGNESTDTVLVRPITQIALYRESELAGALGVRLDRETRSLYEVDPSDPRPELVRNVETDEVNDWMIGRPEEGGNTDDEEEERTTRVFTLEVISGSLRELAR